MKEALEKKLKAALVIGDEEMIKKFEKTLKNLNKKVIRGEEKVDLIEDKKILSELEEQLTDLE